VSAIAVELPAGRRLIVMRRALGRAALFLAVAAALWGLWEGYRWLWSSQGWT